MAKRKMTNPTMRGITRIDQASTRTHGYFARLGWHYRADDSYGPKHTAFFGDLSHGGKRGALRAAQAWRDDILKKDAKKRRNGKKPAHKRG
jgi:hypothetical protein